MKSGIMMRLSYPKVAKQQELVKERTHRLREKKGLHLIFFLPWHAPMVVPVQCIHSFFFSISYHVKCYLLQICSVCKKCRCLVLSPTMKSTSKLSQTIYGCTPFVPFFIRRFGNLIWLAKRSYKKKLRK